MISLVHVEKEYEVQYEGYYCSVWVYGSGNGADSIKVTLLGEEITEDRLGKEVLDYFYENLTTE